MLVAVLQPDKLAAFNITTLEQDMRQDLIVEPDLGIPISLLDTERYAVPDHKPPLAPEDAALLAVRHLSPLQPQLQDRFHASCGHACTPPEHKMTLSKHSTQCARRGRARAEARASQGRAQGRRGSG
jgi:hypothetical protein